MNEQKARALVASLTAEQKIMLLHFLKSLERERPGEAANPIIEREGVS